MKRTLSIFFTISLLVNVVFLLVLCNRISLSEIQGVPGRLVQQVQVWSGNQSGGHWLIADRAMVPENLNNPWVASWVSPFYAGSQAWDANKWTVVAAAENALQKRMQRNRSVKVRKADRIQLELPASQVNVYPEQVADKLMIKAKSVNHEVWGVYIINRTGLVKAFYEFPDSGAERRLIQLDLNGLETGDYEAHIVSGSQRVVRSFKKI